MKSNKEKKNHFSLNMGLKMTVFMTIATLYVGINSIIIENNYLAGIVFTSMAAITCWSYRNDKKLSEKGQKSDK